MTRAALLLSLSLSLLGGCFDSLPADGALKCDVAKCPRGFHCAADQTCWRDGKDPDLSVAELPDGADDSGYDALFSDAAPGEPCSGPTECTSGFCADGVCCDAACAGPCESCNQPGSMGVCTPQPAGPPAIGRKACPGAGTACGALCDGAHAAYCVFPSSATTCGQDCASPCDGNGACATTGICPLGLQCKSGGCPSSCSGNLDCRSGYRCAGGACVAERELDCLDGRDDDNNGLIDCADPQCDPFVMCVPDPGVGEVGFFTGGNCSDDYPSPSPQHQGLGFSPACSNCFCDPQVVCSLSVKFSTAAGCGSIAPPITGNTVVSEFNTFDSTSCITANPTPSPASVSVSTVTTNNSTCQLLGTPSQPVPVWARTLNFCGKARTSAGCAAGIICVGRPSSTGAICARVPSPSPCPTGYTGIAESWNGGFVDDRTCSDCGCVRTATGSCGDGAGDTVDLYTSGSCSSGGQTVSVNSCTAENGPRMNAFIWNKTATNVTFPTCSAPTGSGTVTEIDQSTICCAQCHCATPPCYNPVCPAGTYCDGTSCQACNTVAFCGPICANCAVKGDNCTGGFCMCGSDSCGFESDNCSGVPPLCKCGSGAKCVGKTCVNGSCL